MKDSHAGVETMLGILATPLLQYIAWWIQSSLRPGAEIIFVTVGLWQWIYVIPVCLVLHYGLHRSGLARGLLIGGAVSFLLSCTCFMAFGLK